MGSVFGNIFLINYDNGNIIQKINAFHNNIIQFWIEEEYNEHNYSLKKLDQIKLLVLVEDGLFSLVLPNLLM